MDHFLAADRSGSDLLFGATPASPFDPSKVTRRADDAWEGASLKRLTLHECRHTFASLMIAAGVNAKALSTYMGHANISITLDRYGHLMPGNEEEAAGLLDSYLTAQQERSDERARAAEPESHGTTVGQ
jgi:integrase